MFLDDEEKMKDFNFLSKDEFLKSYSYLDENEYDETAEIYDCLAEKVKEIANTEQIKELKPQYMNDLEFMNLIGKCRDSNSLMEKQLKEIIDKLVIDGLENTSSGNWIINLRDEKEYLLLRENMRLVENYLKSNEKISDVEITKDGIDINFYLDYCQSIEIKSYEDLKKQIEDMDNHLLYKGIAMTVLERFQDEEKDVSLIQIIKATDKIMEQDGAWQNLEECISTVVSDEIHNNKNKDFIGFKIITEDEFKKLFDKFEQNKDFEAEEMENFLIKHDDGVYTAIDNTCGGLYLEDFTTIEEAVKWLNKEDLEKNNENY